MGPSNTSFAGLPTDYFRFFRELSENNNREWFEDNKPRFRATVQEPLAALVEAVGPKLKSVSKHFVADPRLNGGSVFRIYRDVRFSKDKSPYKLHGAIQFRHARGKDAHAPGFYVHLAPGEVFYGGGVWTPPAPALLKIREAIRDNAPAWQKATQSKLFLKNFRELRGDSLSRPPKGFLKDDPMIEDLKRKSFFVMKEGTEASAKKKAFVDDIGSAFHQSSPLMAFLCKALDVPF
ncbi:MAG: DUF2461 domain-containing protein [Pseudomonadota bacterium]